jgi:hypothetical protein
MMACKDNIKESWKLHSAGICLCNITRQLEEYNAACIMNLTVTGRGPNDGVKDSMIIMRVQKVRQHVFFPQKCFNQNKVKIQRKKHMYMCVPFVWASQSSFGMALYVRQSLG